ncbi:hypothetical protein AHAS_Ahas14G0150600 [Arachis hypogaea]
MHRYSRPHFLFLFSIFHLTLSLLSLSLSKTLIPSFPSFSSRLAILSFWPGSFPSVL